MSTDSLPPIESAVHIHLRPAAAGELPAVRRLVESAGLIGGGLEDQFPAAYVVACAGEMLVAVGGLERYGADGFLRSLAVRHDWRGRGLGHRLVAQLLARARADGVRAIYLLTDTASGFFTREGFLPLAREAAPPEIRRAPEFASLCPASSALFFRPVVSP